MSQRQRNARNYVYWTPVPDVVTRERQIVRTETIAVAADAMAVVVTVAPMSVAIIITMTPTTIAAAYFCGDCCMYNSSTYSCMFKEPIPLKICLKFLSLFCAATDVISNRVSVTVYSLMYSFPRRYCCV